MPASGAPPSPDETLPLPRPPLSHRLLRVCPMTSITRVAALLILAALALPAGAHADEPVLLGVEGAFAMPVSNPQFPRFEPGGSLALALHLPLASWIAPVLR